MEISPHASRWLVTVIAAPVILWVLLAGPPISVFILIGLVGLGVWWEFFSAVLGPGRHVLRFVCLAGWAIVAAGAFWIGLPGILSGLVLAAALGFLYFLFTYPKQENLFDLLGRFSLGHLYISLFLSFIIPLYAMDLGSRWILFALLVTFLSDTSAFYAGRSLGKRPLYPSVSPKKTWEGLGGSMVGGGVTAAVFCLVFLNAHWYEAAALGFFLGLWQAGGDLFESMLKRSAGIKDSGRILMGHGGALGSSGRPDVQPASRFSFRLFQRLIQVSRACEQAEAAPRVQ